jgi:hypothetical protein
VWVRPLAFNAGPTASATRSPPARAPAKQAPTHTTFRSPWNTTCNDCARS